MYDQRLRDLERRWTETQELAAGAAWLRARVQAGTLSPGRLSLCAYLGFDPARDAAEGESDLLADLWATAEFHSDQRAVVEDLLQRLVDLGEEALLVAIWSIVRRELPHSEPPHHASDAAVEELLESVESYLRSPLAASREGLLSARRRAWPNLAVEMHGDLRLIVSLPDNLIPGSPTHVPYEATLATALLRLDNSELSVGMLGRYVAAILDALQPDAFLEALREDLLPWLLSPDPRASSRGA